jgi:hypothetical protein
MLEMLQLTAEAAGVDYRRMSPNARCTD